MVAQYVSGQDEVISHVNISSLKDEDGGEYSCSAKNKVGEITYSARINVYGNRQCFSILLVNYDEVFSVNFHIYRSI